MTRQTLRSKVALAWLLVLAAPLALSGCGGTTGSTPSTITVHGTVIDTTYDPVSDASVLIDGQVTTTASDGTFTVAGVHAPYDAAISYASWYDVYVYEGLTRTDPTLQAYQTSAGSHATISGTIGTTSFQSSESGVVFPEGGSIAIGEVVAPTGSGPAFGPGYLYWPSTGPLTTTLFGLRALLDGSGNPTSFTGYGSLPVTVHDGDALTGLTIPMVPVATGSLSGDIQAPSGYTLTNLGIVVRFGTSSAGAVLGLPVANATPQGSFTDSKVPVASGIGYGLIATANDSNGNGTAGWGSVSGAGSGATYALPSAPDVSVPSNGATGVTTSTLFSWASLTGSVYVLNVGATTGSGPWIHVITTRTTATIPDLSVINRALPNNSPLHVNLWTVGPFASMDAATGLWHVDMVLESFFGGGTPLAAAGPSGPGWETNSKTRTVTTAP